MALTKRLIISGNKIGGSSKSKSPNDPNYRHCLALQADDTFSIQMIDK